MSARKPWAGFQAGWLRLLGCLGLKWILTRGDCDGCSTGCLNCPHILFRIGTALRCIREALLMPTRVGGRRAFFVAPEGDLFHDNISKAFIAEVFAVIEHCHQHIFVLLTKREKRLFEMVACSEFPMMVYNAGRALFGDNFRCRGADWASNLYLGVSVENQKHVDRLLVLPHLPECIKRIIFVSPMVSHVDLLHQIMQQGVDWVVCTGEMGKTWPGANVRPCDLEWQKDLLDQVQSYGVPFYLHKKRDRKWIDRMENRSFLEFPPAFIQ